MLALQVAECSFGNVEQQSAQSISANVVHEIKGWRKAAIWVLAMTINLWNRTLRFEVTDQDRAILGDTSAPLVAVLWHNRILIASEMRRRFRNGRPMAGMVSASRDGAWLATFFRMVGIGSARGSSSRRALGAAREMLSLLKSGHDVAITPDGPRGPIYTFHEGAAALALASNARVLLLGANFKSAWRLNSWDGFYLPKPFSKVTIQARILQSAELPRDRDAAATLLRTTLMAMTEDLKDPPKVRRA